jgi:hypothetical protein
MLVVASISLMKKAKRPYHLKKLSIQISAVKGGPLTHSRVVLSIQESGKEVSVTAMVSNNGLMVLAMKESGEKTELMEKVSSFMLMVTYMTVNGLTIKQTA